MTNLPVLGISNRCTVSEILVIMEWMHGTECLPGILNQLKHRDLVQWSLYKLIKKSSGPFIAFLLHLGCYSLGALKCINVESLQCMDLVPLLWLQNVYKFSTFNINRWNIVHCQSNTSVNISEDESKEMWETNRLHHGTVKLNTNTKEELYVSIIIVMPYYYSPISIIQT